MAEENKVEAEVKNLVQEPLRAAFTGVQIASGVRDEVIETGEHILQGVTAPAQEAISQGPAATLAYVNSLSPAFAADTLAKAALGDEAAKAKVMQTGEHLVDIAEAFPKSLGENVARGELAAQAGNAHAFGTALGAMAILGVGGPGGKVAEAAATSDVIRVVENELVDTAGSVAPAIAADVKVGAVPSATTPVATIVDPKYSPAATALQNSNLPDSAKQALSPVANVLDEAKNVLAPPKPVTMQEHMNQAVSESYKRDNIFKEALHGRDGAHIDARTGQSIAEATHYNQWNKEQVATRAQFYNEVFQHRPELVAQLEQQGITQGSVKNLLMSPVNDHLMGIKPYEGYQEQAYTHGYAADKALAKEWGIEYKEQKAGWGGVLQDLAGKNEITMNKELQDAKKAVAAAEELQQLVHQDTAKRILIPDLPRNPELDAKVQQLLAARLEDGTLSAEARQALPAELRALPVKHLEALQEKAQQAVATDQLRLTAHQQEALLIGGSGQGAAKAETNMVAAEYNVMSQAIRDSFSQSLAVANNTKAPVAEIVPLTEAQIAAKQKVAEFTEGKSTAAVATRFVIDTAAGGVGAGYNFGQLELAKMAEKASESDYAALKTGVETGLKKTATTLGVVGTAVVAPVAIPVGFVGVVATKMVINNQTAMAAIKGTAEAAKDYVAGAVDSLRSPQRDALVDTLPKGADGELTAQSQQVLKMVDQRMADAQVKTPDIPPEITR